MSGVRSGSSAAPGSSRLAAGSWAVPFANPRAHMAVARTAMKGLNHVERVQPSIRWARLSPDG
jgi:hypothetical protein